MYCFTVCCPIGSFVSSFNDGTTATITCIAIDAPMYGPMPTWKNGIPGVMGSVANRVPVPRPRPKSRERPPTPALAASAGTSPLRNFENTFAPTSPPASPTSYIRIGISVPRRTTRMYFRRFRNRAATSFVGSFDASRSARRSPIEPPSAKALISSMAAGDPSVVAAADGSPADGVPNSSSSAPTPMSRYTFRVASSFEDDAPRRTAPPRREDRTDVDASAGEERTRRATHAREEEEVEVARAPPRGQATAGTATADITSSVLQHDGGARRVCRRMR